MIIQQENIISVGIAEMATVKAPNLVRTSGLGSCVGVILYDSIQQIAGLAHVMLPDSSLSRKKPIQVAKYADTAVEALINELLSMGANKSILQAKIAGGAQMFKFITENEMMKIGARNVKAIKYELKKYSIPIVAEDVGGSNGRTIVFNPETTKLSIRTVNQGTQEI